MITHVYTWCAMNAYVFTYMYIYIILYLRPEYIDIIMSVKTK